MDDDPAYLQSGFDPTDLKVAELRGLLLKHDVQYPSTAKKAQLVALFELHIAPHASQILAQRNSVRASSKGIVSATPRRSSRRAKSRGSVTADDGSPVGDFGNSDQEEVEPPKTVRRSGGGSSTDSQLSMDNVFQKQSPARSTPAVSEDSRRKGPFARRPTEFSVESFEIPYNQRTEAFYSWREQLIRSASEVVMSDAARLAAMANEDYYQQVLAKRNHEIESLMAKNKQIEIEMEGYQVAGSQLQKLLEEKDDRVEIVTKELEKKEAENMALRLQAVKLSNGLGNGANPNRNRPPTSQPPMPPPMYSPPDARWNPKFGVFTIKLQELPTFDGEKDAEQVIMFISGIERAFRLRAIETGTTGSTISWGDYAVQRLTGKAAEWAELTWLSSERVDWEDFKHKLVQEYTPADYISTLGLAFAVLAWDSKQQLSEFNDKFRSMHTKLHIVSKLEDIDDIDSTVYDIYTRKLEQAASEEKSSGPASMILSAYVQWVALKDIRPTLTEVMTFCAKVDDIHNRHTILALEKDKTSRTNATFGNRPATTTSEGEDSMDISR